MKLAETFNFLQLRNKIIDKKIPVKTLYKFTRFFNQLESEGKFFNETLQSIIDTYGQRDENGEFILTDNGQGIKIKEDKSNECMKKINELNEIEVQLSYIPKFTLDELEGLELDFKEMELLIPYIEEN